MFRPERYSAPNQLPATPEQYSGHPGTTFRQNHRVQELSDIADERLSAAAADLCPHQAIVIDLYHQKPPQAERYEFKQRSEGKTPGQMEGRRNAVNLEWWAKFFGYTAERPTFDRQDHAWIAAPSSWGSSGSYRPVNFAKISESTNEQAPVTPAGRPSRKPSSGCI